MYRIILPAIREHLLQGLSTHIERTNTGHTFDGRPPAMAPSLYISIHPQGRTAEYNAQLALSYPVQITLTMRRNIKDTASLMPALYFGTDDRPGLEEYIDMVIGQMHGGDNQRAVDLAATIRHEIETRYTGISGPQQPYQLISESAPHPVNSDWWGGKNEDQNGMKVDLTFGANDMQHPSDPYPYGSPL